MRKKLLLIAFVMIVSCSSETERQEKGTILFINGSDYTVVEVYLSREDQLQLFQEGKITEQNWGLNMLENVVSPGDSAYIDTNPGDWYIKYETHNMYACYKPVFTVYTNKITEVKIHPVPK